MTVCRNTTWTLSWWSIWPGAAPLSPAEAAQVVADVLGYFSEPPEDFVRRRHPELKARGLTNDQIFEPDRGRDPAAALYARRITRQRQLRRIIYG